MEHLDSEVELPELNTVCVSSADVPRGDVKGDEELRPITF